MLDRIDHGSQACTIFSQMMKERSYLESLYAKELSKWADKWSAKVRNLPAGCPRCDCAVW